MTQDIKINIKNFAYKLDTFETKYTWENKKNFTNRMCTYKF